MSRFTDPVEKLGLEAKGYIDTRVDDLKLQAAKGLSEGTTALAGLVLIVVVLSALALVLSFAGVLLLGELLDSYAKAAFIVAGALLLLLVILILLRNKLFRNSFVGLYTGIFSPEEAEATPIRTQKQLDAALARSKNRIQKREEAIRTRVESTRNFYSPKNMLITAVRSDILPLFVRLVAGRRRRKK